MQAQSVLKVIRDHKRPFAIVLIVAVLLCASFLLLYELGSQPLHNDEARYAQIVTENLLTSHNYFALTYRLEPYFNKPPLLFWSY